MMQLLPLITGVVFIGAVVGGFWKLYGRVGMNPAWSLLMLVPLVNIAVLWYVACAKWRFIDTKTGYPAHLGRGEGSNE